MGLILLVTFGDDLVGRPVSVFGLGAAELNTIGGLLLMLPFLLFSAVSGQVADKVAKHRMMRSVKLAEVVLMVGAAGALIVASLGAPELAGAGLLALIFLLGTQSAVFGPIKYSILPQLLPKPGELVAGNALVETGTYLAVLLGGITATVLMVGPRDVGLPPEIGLYTLAGGVVGFALIGWWAARMTPAVPAEQPDLQVRWDPIRTTVDVARVVTARRDLLLAVLANSWFWGLAACLLALTPSWSANTLGADEWTATGINAVFSIGIGVGSLLCAQLSRGRIELGLVSLGASGLLVFLVDLGVGGAPWTPPAADAARLGLLDVLSRPAAWRLVMDLVLLAASGGIFMVPLYSYLLDRGAEGERARLIGALNVMTAVFMVGALAVVFGLLAAGLSERSIFLVLGLVQAAITALCIVALPVPTMRFVAEGLIRVFYRPRFANLDRIPAEGPALLICNHVSYIDFVVLMAAVRRRHRFVIWHAFVDIPAFGFLARNYHVIPINSDPKDRRTIVKAFKEISETLRQGELVILFPEGALPYEQGLQPFMRGLDLILKRDPVPVVPMALNGLWGSPYSRKGGRAFKSVRGPKRRIWLTVGEPVPPSDATRERLEEEVRALWTSMPDRP